MTAQVHRRRVDLYKVRIESSESQVAFKEQQVFTALRFRGVSIFGPSHLFKLPVCDQM